MERDKYDLVFVGPLSFGKTVVDPLTGCPRVLYDGGIVRGDLPMPLKLSNPTPFAWRLGQGLQTVVVLGALSAVAACAPTTPGTPSPGQQAAGTVSGQLFCALQKAGGGQIVASIVEAKVAGMTADPSTQALAVLATNTGKVFVDNTCDKAAIAAGAVSAVPVAPPPANVTVAPVAVIPDNSLIGKSP